MMEVPGGEDEILWCSVLKAHPYRFHEIRRNSPVALGAEISQREDLLRDDFDSSDGRGDLVCQEALAVAGGTRDCGEWS